MGKASSSKKVARAARAGGATTGNRRKLGFPAAVVAICIVGLAVVLFAKGQFGTAAAEPPTIQDHWHAAYGINICGNFQQPIADARGDSTGIHTHADGVIHIHPFTASHGGKNATLSKWGQVVGMEFGNGSFTTQDGTTYSNGYDCNGKPATVSVYKWPADDPNAAPEVFTGDLGDVHLGPDRAAITIAVVPEGTEVPRPPTVPVLDALTDVPNSSTSTPPTTAPATTPSTTAPAGAPQPSVPTSTP